MWRGRTSSDIWVDALLDLVAKWGVRTVAEEKGGLASAVRPFLLKRIRERQTYFELVSLSSVEDKIDARSVNPRPHGAWAWSAGRKRPRGTRPRRRNVSLSPPPGTTMLSTALSLAGRLLAGMSKGSKPLPEPRAMRGITVEATGDPLTPVRYVYPVHVRRNARSARSRTGAAPTLPLSAPGMTDATTPLASGGVVGSGAWSTTLELADVHTAGDLVKGAALSLAPIGWPDGAIEAAKLLRDELDDGAPPLDPSNAVGDDPVVSCPGGASTSPRSR